MAHLLISAAHKSSGKTTLTIGICAALSARGVRVQPFKKGPDYIDPMWLTLAAGGTACRNLDFYTMAAGEIAAVFGRAMQGAELGVIEGNKGLHDGVALDGSNSSAALAALLGAPVVLVMDARGMTRGVAALVRGLQAFEPRVSIRGVILNRVGGRRHEQKLRAAIEHYTDVELIGAVGEDSALEIVERHLGLVPSNEQGDAAGRVGQMARRVEGCVDLDRLIAIAATAQAVPAVEPVTASEPAPAAHIRIAIARDAAFGFYYPDDLDALRQAGAELIPFDTLRDTELPAADGLLIGGGFPETQMERLEANAPLRRAIREAIEGGMPAYAECGGLMYLARRITWEGRCCEMVGAIPADVVMHRRPQGRGYVRLEETPQCPWPRRVGEPRISRRVIAAHEFHYSAIEGLPQDTVFAYRVLRGSGVDGARDGIVHRNLLANYAHLRDVEQCRWASRFVEFVRERRREPESRTVHCGTPRLGGSRGA